jgi:DNA-binding response OmpR family regulator
MIRACLKIDLPPDWKIHVEAPKILIVDDERDLVETCARFFKLANYECVQAFDKSGAILKIDEFSPHLVLTDLHLPDGTGFEVIRYARSKNPGLVAIMITAYHSPDAEKTASEAGVNAYLSKPFAMSDLSKAVERTIDRICLSGPL